MLLRTVKISTHRLREVHKVLLALVSLVSRDKLRRPWWFLLAHRRLDLVYAGVTL